jgi:hypothetical protein
VVFIARDAERSAGPKGGGGDGLHLIDALGSFEDGVDQDRSIDPVLALKLGQQLIEVVDIPWSFNLRQHDHVELPADRTYDLNYIVQRPRRVERVDPGPKPGRAEINRLSHFNEAVPCRALGVRRDCVLKITQHHVDLADKFRDFRAHFVDVRRHKMDHALEPAGEFSPGLGGPDCQWSIEVACKLHGVILKHATLGKSIRPLEASRPSPRRKSERALGAWVNPGLRPAMKVLTDRRQSPRGMPVCAAPRRLRWHRGIYD